MANKNNEIGKRIKRCREEYPLSQSSLAQKLGVSQRNISYYENGERIPPADIILKLVEIFKVSSDYLLGISDQRFPDEDLKWRYPHAEKRLGTILKRYCSQSKISEDDFAQKLGIRKDLLTEIELGIYTPSLKLLQNISMITGYDIDFLTGAKSATHRIDDISGHQLFESDSHFLARLEEQCLMRNITYENVTEKLGLSKEVYIDITCNRMPTLAELLRIAYGLEVSVDYLIGRTDIPNINLTEDEIALLTDYRDCIEPYKKNIRDRAERLSIESATRSSSIEANESNPKTGTDNLGK